METVLIRIAENSPVLALLGIVLIIVFRMVNKLIMAFLNTLQNLNTNFANLVDIVKEQGIKTESFIRIIDEAHIAELQAHQYQKMEHEQMVKILERLNGK